MKRRRKKTIRAASNPHRPFDLQELCKYARGELNAERELQVIQYVIGQGIEREELRDEIFVQCMRQATNNPHAEWTDRIWLLMCLAIVAFQPSKVLIR